MKRKYRQLEFHNREDKYEKAKAIATEFNNGLSEKHDFEDLNSATAVLLQNGWEIISH